MKRTIILTLLMSLFTMTTAHAQTVVYYHTDALGTPVAVTDASGNVVERSEYEPYGSLLNRPLTDGPGYTGHVMDAVTGLTYMQQRYYDQTIGRFVSTDPVTADAISGANFNRYWYANNNPLNFKDLDGRAPNGELGRISSEDLVRRKLPCDACVFSEESGDGWFDGKMKGAKENLERVGAAMSGDWKNTVKDASWKFGWTAPDYGLGSGTMQIGLENGHPAFDFHGGWGAAGGHSGDLVTDWVSTPDTAGKPRAWFGMNLKGALSFGPLRGKLTAADGALVIAPRAGIKGYSEHPGASLDIRPSASLSASVSGGGFVRIGLVAPDSIISEGN